VEITIDGTLNVLGTASFPVVFRGQTASPGSWYGITSRSGALATLNHAFIQHAITGLMSESTAVQANNVTAFANQTAISVGGGGGISVVRSVIYANTIQGFQINPSGRSFVTIDHCTLHRNGTNGVYIGSASMADVTIRNTIITATPYSVYRSGSAAGTASVTYSVFWANGSNHLVNVVAGTGVFSADPLYIDAEGADNLFGTADDNLRLQPNTPCAYRSDTGQDIGAYENAKLVILRPELIGEDVRFRVLSISNRLHLLQFTEDFSSWTSVASNRPSATGSIYLTNFGVRNLPRRFYRVRLDD
jgi:hypothetical protein